MTDRERLEKQAQEWGNDRCPHMAAPSAQIDCLKCFADLLERVEREATQRERERVEGEVCAFRLEVDGPAYVDYQRVRDCDELLRRIKGED